MKHEEKIHVPKWRAMGGLSRLCDIFYHNCFSFSVYVWQSVNPTQSSSRMLDVSDEKQDDEKCKKGMALQY